MYGINEIRKQNKYKRYEIKVRNKINKSEKAQKIN